MQKGRVICGNGNEPHRFEIANGRLCVVGTSAHTLSTQEVVIVDCAQGFAALEKEWENLYQNSPLATPFQSWSWLYSWWESYAEDYQLRLITVRAGDLLVGIVPLMLERRWELERLLFIGTGLTNHNDLLAREGWYAQVSEAARRALKEMGGWQVIDLQQVRPQAAAWNLFKGWAGPRSCIWQDNSPVIEVRGWEELLASVSRKLRGTARRSLRRAEEDGARFKLAGVEEAERAGQRFVDLHREAWRGRGIAPKHLDWRFEAHILAAARRLTARRLGGISELWRDNEVIAADFLLFDKGFTEGYLVGASQEALRRYQVSSLMLENALNIARNRGSKCLSMGRGEERYKVRWSSGVIPDYRIILGRSLTPWAPYTGSCALYSRARRYMNTEKVPRLAKRMVRRYRHARRKAAARRLYK